MLRIGIFARLGQVSVKTLRHYDEIGLLSPDSVDEASGYRHYALEQLPRLNRILALKDLGFSLDQIAELLHTGPAPERIRDMLCVRRAELQNRVREDQDRLERVEARLQLIEQEDSTAQYDILLKPVAPQLVACVREVITDWKEVYETFCRLFDALRSHIAAEQGKITGPACNIWHSVAADPMQLKVEAAIPLQHPLPGTKDIRVRELPGIPLMASSIHHGRFITLHLAEAAVLRWAQANHYALNGPNRQIFLRCDRHGDPDDNLTEVQFPVAKASATGLIC